MTCGIGLWQHLSYKRPRGLTQPHVALWKKEFDFKGNWGGLLCHQILPNNSPPPTEITGDAICPRDGVRVSPRKPGWDGTCSQSPGTEPCPCNWGSLRWAVPGWDGNSTKSPGSRHFRLHPAAAGVCFLCEDSSLHLFLGREKEAREKGSWQQSPAQPICGPKLPLPSARGWRVWKHTHWAGQTATPDNIRALSPNKRRS